MPGITRRAGLPEWRQLAKCTRLPVSGPKLVAPHTVRTAGRPVPVGAAHRTEKFELVAALRTALLLRRLGPCATATEPPLPSWLADYESRHPAAGDYGEGRPDGVGVPASIMILISALPSVAHGCCVLRLVPAARLGQRSVAGGRAGGDCWAGRRLGAGGRGGGTVPADGEHTI